METEKEPDWQRLGDLLKAALGTPIEEIKKDGILSRMVLDYMTQQPVQIPCNPKLSLKDQIEKFYQNSKRKQKRYQETKARMERFQETIDRLEPLLLEKPAPLDWDALQKFEQAAGIQHQKNHFTSDQSQKHQRKNSAWLGRSFISQDGSPILIGRNKDENSELTFKHARGNDIWMHVRGRPGAHVLIPIFSGKSASLETLLDAAHLAIHYSGGGDWTKTEVDYTFKKNVKRIKNSTEVQYTHCKTLIVNTDPTRMKRLLGSNNRQDDRKR
jgi:predicted ribosome quality control (RQC) complex YloA/Tae2 family protein